MNRQITRLAVTGVVLVVALIVATTYWQTWAAAGLADRQDNAIQKVAQFTIDRGEIVGPGGAVYATNVKRRVKGKTLYFRRYPQHQLAAHVIGYSTVSRSRTGLELTQNDYLTGSNANLGTVVDTTLDRLRGSTIHGNDVHITIVPGAQRLAQRLLRARCGAVVALHVKTGRVLVLASSPTYDPNLVERRGGWARINRTRGQCRGASALYNRATQGLFTPGSTFKVVTAAAALDTGRYSPSSTFVDPGYCIEYGKKVRNAGNPEAPETFGRLNFVTALEHSVNSVFCNIGKRLGAGKIIEYSKRFGFYSRPPLETPPDERAASGLYRNGRLFDPQRPEFQVDPGRFAFGQERLLATPLQMAMVAAAVGNGGVVMRPYVVSRVTAPEGGTVTKTKPDRLGRAIKPQTARDLTQMMVAAVNSGTGTAAQIPGVQVAGKTGTAEVAGAQRNQLWFIGFAPVERPRMAIAVTLEDQPLGTAGGQVAAPLAAQVLEELIG